MIKNVYFHHEKKIHGENILWEMFSLDRAMPSIMNKHGKIQDSIIDLDNSTPSGVDNNLFLR